MSSRGTKRNKVVKPAPSPGSLRALAEGYVEWLSVRNYSPMTIDGRRRRLASFFDWAEARALHSPGDITRAVLERYQRHLFHQESRLGRPLSMGVQRERLLIVKAYFRWMVRQGHAAANPASDLDLPRQEHRLPRHVLTPPEAERVLAQPDVGEVLGLRDRAMLEVLYSTGLRRMELRDLDLSSIDYERGTLIVRQGKGKKDRVVPIGERAAAWVEKYVHESRPKLLVPPDSGVLFLTDAGLPFILNTLSDIVRRYVDRAELGKRGSCHLFRHTFATVLLENGADIRHIQEMLGHAQLSTTQMYAHVSIRRLKLVHEAAHPAARLKARESPGDGASTLDVSGPEPPPAPVARRRAR